MARQPRSQGVRVGIPSPGAVSVGLPGGVIVGRALQDFGAGLATATRGRMAAEEVRAAEAKAKNLAFHRSLRARDVSAYELDEQRFLMEARENAELGAPDFAKTYEDAAQGRIDALMAGLPEDTPEEVRRDFATTLERSKDGAVLAAEQFELGARRDAKVLGLTDVIDNTSAGLESNPVTVFSDIERVTNEIRAADLPAVQEQELIQDAQRTLARSGVNGIARQNPYEARRMVSEGLFDDFVTGQDKNVLLNAIDVDIARREAEAARQARLEAEALAAQEEVLEGRVDDALRIMAAGRAPAGLDQLVVDLEAGSPEQLNRLAAGLDLASYGAQLSTGLVRDENGAPVVSGLPAPAVVDAEILRLQGKSELTPEELDKLETALDVRDAMTSGLASDPLGYVAETGLVALGDLDLTDAASVFAREQAAAVGRGVMGVAMPPLTAGELARLRRDYDAADTDGRLAILEDVASAPFSKDTGDALLSTISRGDQVMGLLALRVDRLGLTGLELARDVEDGRAFLANNPKSLPDRFDSGADAMFQEFMGDSLALDADGSGHAALKTAAAAAYATAMLGKDGSVFDPDVYRAQLQRLAGETARINGHDVLAPAGVKPYELERRFAALDDAAIHAPHPGAPGAGGISAGPHRIGRDGALARIDADDLTSDWYPVALVEGLYLAAHDGPGGIIEYAVTADGTPWRFALGARPAAPRAKLQGGAGHRRGFASFRQGVPTDGVVDGFTPRGGAPGGVTPGAIGVE